MPRMCTICHKTKSRGHTRKLLRGHRNITGRRYFEPNLQPATINGLKILACTKCIRTASRKGRGPL